MSVIFGSIGGVGLLVSLALRWNDLLLLWPTDQTRRYYAGFELYERFGAPGGLLSAIIVVAGLGAISTSAHGNAKVTLGFGVLALVTVAVGCLALLMVGLPESRIGGGSLGFETKLGLGAVLGVVSAVLAVVGGVLAWRERSLTIPA